MKSSSQNFSLSQIVLMEECVNADYFSAVESSSCELELSVLSMQTGTLYECISVYAINIESYS